MTPTCRARTPSPSHASACAGASSIAWRYKVLASSSRLSRCISRARSNSALLVTVRRFFSPNASPGPSRQSRRLYSSGWASEPDQFHIENPLDEPHAGNERDCGRSEHEDHALIERRLAQCVRDRQEHADDHELPQLDAEIERDERDKQRLLRQPEVGEHRCESEAVNQAETEGDDPALFVDRRPDIVERRENDRERDRRLDPARRKRDDAERGERERDRVRERESG